MGLEQTLKQNKNIIIMCAFLIGGAFGVEASGLFPIGFNNWGNIINYVLIGIIGLGAYTYYTLIMSPVLTPKNQSRMHNPKIPNPNYEFEFNNLNPSETNQNQKRGGI